MLIGKTQLANVQSKGRLRKWMLFAVLLLIGVAVFDFAVEWDWETAEVDGYSKPLHQNYTDTSVHIQACDVGMCQVYMANGRVTTDSGGIGYKEVPHATYYLCREVLRKGCNVEAELGVDAYKNLVSAIERDKQWYSEAFSRNGRIPVVPEDEYVYASFVMMRTARSGFSWVQKLHNNVLNANGLPTSFYYEPLCRKNCYHKRSVEEEEVFLRLLLGHKGCKMPRDGGGCVSNRTSFCAPQDPQPRRGGISVNPRFMDRVNWKQVGYDHTRFILVRRTNLLRMAISKVLKNGCSPHDPVTSTSGKYWFPSYLQACIKTYPMQEQEFAISAALQGALPDKLLLLVLFEDLVSSPEIVEKQLYEFWDMEPPEHLIHRIQKGKTQMEDMEDVSFDICETNIHVVCERDASEPFVNEVTNETFTGLYDSWQLHTHPCLHKMVMSADPWISWTMPMLPNKTISMEGDCFPLHKLTRSSPPRRVSELYMTDFPVNPVV